MLRQYRKPLIVTTPKSLLRSKATASELSLVENGQFQLVIDDRFVPDKEAVQRVVLCSGKVFYDLNEQRDNEDVKDVAIVRLEQLYPFPHDEVMDILGRYPNAVEITWCQEEPQNQGAWYCIKHNVEACVSDSQTLFYAGRPSAASPAVGQYSVHIEEQQKLVGLALNTGQGQKQRKITAAARS